MKKKIYYNDPKILSDIISDKNNFKPKVLTKIMFKLWYKKQADFDRCIVSMSLDRYSREEIIIKLKCSQTTLSNHKRKLKKSLKEWFK